MGQLQTVTKIAAQKSSSTRFNVYLNGKYAFSISEDIYVKFHIHKGKKLSNEQIAKIQYEDHLHRAYIVAIHYLSYRMRTENEIKSHLRKKDFSKEVIDEVISRLYKEKLLDDEQFAISFVNDRINRSTKGPLIVARELLEKGISKDHIHIALGIYSREKQKEIALRWAEKEIKKKSKHPLKRRKQRLSMNLLRRGFEKVVVEEVIASLSIKTDNDEELLLLKKEANKLYNKYKHKYEPYELEIRLKQRLYSRGFELGRIESYIQTLLDE